MKNKNKKIKIIMKNKEVLLWKTLKKIKIL